MTHVRTRFAPSPTGFIHLGNIRSALYPWAFAKAKGGDFILRIEDTDLERSNQASVDVILQAMQWLGLEPNEGPYYQMQRMARYKEVLEQLKSSGHVYPCYMSRAELDTLRERQEAQKIKPRYDGTWRPEAGKVLPEVPASAQAVLRFKTPLTGSVIWEDKVKGRIEINNSELDDLVIARPDGTPTYNFCVVVDDIDMRITHVIRGDDHINNTPRQIHIFNALGVQPPIYAHLPTVLNADGEKMSKRDPKTKSVMQYAEEGFLPEAMINYLARLGWSHGDDEIFSRAQFLEWFDLEHLGKSAAQFDEAKLRWVNAQHLKTMENAALAALVQPYLGKQGVAEDSFSPERLQAGVALFKDRCETLQNLAQWLRAVAIAPDWVSLQTTADWLQHLAPAHLPTVQAALTVLLPKLRECDWEVPAINAAFKATLQECGLKMPQVAMPVRVLTLGQAHTPSVDAVLYLIGREQVLARLQRLG